MIQRGTHAFAALVSRVVEFVSDGPRKHGTQQPPDTGWMIRPGPLGAMLSRPSRDQSRCIDMLAAKACSPGRDCGRFRDRRPVVRRRVPCFRGPPETSPVASTCWPRKHAPRAGTAVGYESVGQWSGGGCHAFAALRRRVQFLRHTGRESMLPGPGLRSVTRALGSGPEEGAMLSRPAGDESRSFDMLAAKACSRAATASCCGVAHMLSRPAGRGLLPLFRGPRKHGTPWHQKKTRFRVKEKAPYLHLRDRTQP